jgi:hypothetical protein
MCFGGSMPQIKQPAPPPTERAGTLSGLGDRQRAAQTEMATGASSTMLSQSDSVKAGTKPRLGA